MKEYPILFSSEMIQAILEHRKFQTRRVLKKQPLDILPMKVHDLWVTLRTREPEPHGDVIRCRYGVPGDRLWVRETFQIYEPSGSVGDEWIGDTPSEVDGRLPKEKPEALGHWWNIAYKADDPDAVSWWRPSIFMPRWASRIDLEIVKIRVERLQEITETDACAEGVDNLHLIYKHGPSYRDTYAELWDRLNKKRGFGWDTNPFVWVIEFKTLEGIKS